MKQKKAAFVIRVEDRRTHERMDFDIIARSVQEAEKRAMDAGWIVVNPTTEPAPEPSESELQAARQERAVMFGTLKALGIAALVIIGLIVVGNVVVFLASQ